jgi:hypothetical protein
MVNRNNRKFVSILMTVIVCGLFLSVWAASDRMQNLVNPDEIDQNNVTVLDIFDRSMNERGIVLVDFDGYMANPAMQYFLVPPENASYPSTATITADCARIYFNEPCTVGSSGPSKTIVFIDESSVESFYMSIWPDRDTEDEKHALSIEFTDSNGLTILTNVSIAVIDQDVNLPLLYHVFVDFSQDQTSFFENPDARRIVQQAASDWAYFIDDMGLDTVPAGAEITWIWNPDGFNSGYNVTNREPYTGFLLYAYGTDHPDLRSGGEGSYTGFQRSDGGTLLLRRSGGIEMHIRGNYNEQGWFYTTGDDDWLESDNMGGPTDFYSIVHHEMGHAFFFCPAYPLWVAATAPGFLDDPNVTAYLGQSANVDLYDHMPGVIDPISNKGVFGAEYYQDSAVKMPRRRWLITKFDLLAARAAGFKLRQTSAFIPLSIEPVDPPNAVVNLPYLFQPTASGGIPLYHWSIDSGSLPDGLVLDSFTGQISGIPTAKGNFNFAVKVSDYGLAEILIYMNMCICPTENPNCNCCMSLSEFAEAWLGTSFEAPSANWNPNCDLAPRRNPDGRITFRDYATLAPMLASN